MSCSRGVQSTAILEPTTTSAPSSNASPTASPRNSSNSASTSCSSRGPAPPFHASLGLHGLRSRAVGVLRSQVLPWRVRSGLLSGHHSLLHLLVSWRVPGAHYRDLHERHRGRWRPRRPDLRLDHERYGRGLGSEGLAMDVHPRGPPDHVPRAFHLLLSG